MKRLSPPVTVVDAYLLSTVKRIRQVFPATRRIILFGSHAYGRPTKDSDLDLYVEVPTRLTSRRRYEIINRVLDPRPCGIDLVIKTPAETQRILKDFNPCFEDILSKGRVLYAKTW